MNIKLYKTNSAPNRVDKSQYLNSTISIQGSLVDETNVMTPSILIKNSDAGKILQSNYAYIPEFDKRYYFITSIDSVRNGLFRINMKIDVLMTYKGAIKQLNAIISKYEKPGQFTNNFYNDGTFKNTEETVIQYLDSFPNDRILYNMNEGAPVYLLTCF